MGFVDHVRPVSDWFALTWGTIVGWQLVLNVGWLGVGLTLSWGLWPTRVPLRERIAVSVPLGVVAFVLALYALGAVGEFRPFAAVALAVAFIAAGAPGLRRGLREWRAPVSDPVPPSKAGRLLGLGASVAGYLAAGILYLGVMTPDAVNYDARWMHMGIAADYARTRHLLGFSGDWVRCYPHLASLLHTWSFLVPGFDLPPARWLMALHTEFALFLWTLVALAAAINWLVAKVEVPGAWAAYFLFPAIFIYDNNMGGAADHVLAFFVLPLFLLSVRLPGERRPGPFVLWGIVAGGALLTKYQAIYVIFPAALVCFVWSLGKKGLSWSGLQATIKQLGFTAVAFLGVTAPHFLKNWVFHHNPVYPLGQDLFRRSAPALRDSPLFVRYLLTDWAWKAPTELGPRFGEAFELMATFAFKPHYSFVGEVPTFGFLFTLSIPLLLFVPHSKRLWSVVFVSLSALFAWAFTYRVDRNLQIVVPLFAATTVGILVRAWRVGRLARVGVGVLVLFQLVWGGDLVFGGSERMVNSLAILRSTLDGRGGSRFAGMSGDYLGLDRALPEQAVILLHHWHPQLGINREVHLDWAGFQGEIDYRNFANARDLYFRLKALGITHVVYLPGEQATSFRQQDVVFHSLAINHGGPKTRVGMFEFFALPPEPPPARPPLQVLALGLGDYADGLYDVTQLNTCRFLPTTVKTYAPPKVDLTPTNAAALLAQSDAVLLGGGRTINPAIAPELGRDFVSAAPYPGLTVYIRSPGR